LNGDPQETSMDQNHHHVFDVEPVNEAQGLAPTSPKGAGGALSTTGALDGLLESCAAMRARIRGIAASIDKETVGAMRYFLDGCREHQGRVGLSVEQLFNVEAACAALHADYWSKAMALTDVLECMPEVRRNEWRENIGNHTTPAFNADTVIPTFEALLGSRERFFAERVDGIFNALSRQHLTNRPEGFAKRMIVPFVWEGGFPRHHACGFIHDLRSVIARFMGRGDPRWNATDSAVRSAARASGEWITLDGGALRLRVYRGVGTAHLEVHPDMAWRLNAVLASLHPAAIPTRFRQPPKRKQKAVQLLQRPLPFQVLDVLAGLEPARHYPDGRQGRGLEIPRTLAWRPLSDKELTRQVEAALRSIGGVPCAAGWTFDFEPRPVIETIVLSGCVPDARSHQFYPTPELVAAAAVQLARVEPGNSVLEPSAGLGALAELLPVGTQCVEVSELHCAVLRERGFDVERADFLRWASSCTRRFDRVVMNPPFSEGRWLSHLQAAAALLAPGGRCVAILPASARDKVLVPGLRHTWGEIFENAFDGTGIAVTLLALEQAGSL
jgi:hypothetical protein